MVSDNSTLISVATKLDTFFRQQKVLTQLFVCLLQYETNQNIDFSMNLWARSTLFQACCLTGTRPSPAPLQQTLLTGVYGNICCLLLLGTQGGFLYIYIYNYDKAARSVPVFRMLSKVTYTFMVLLLVCIINWKIINMHISEWFVVFQELCPTCDLFIYI